MQITHVMLPVFFWEICRHYIRITCLWIICRHYGLIFNTNPTISKRWETFSCYRVYVHDQLFKTRRRAFQWKVKCVCFSLTKFNFLKRLQFIVYIIWHYVEMGNMFTEGTRIRWHVHKGTNWMNRIFYIMYIAKKQKHVWR